MLSLFFLAAPVSAGPLKVGWVPDLNSTQFARFKTWVDNANANTYAFDAAYPAMMYQWTSQASYCTKAINLTETFVLSEEALISGGSNPTVAGDSYLEAGPVLWPLSLTFSECNGMLTAGQKTRWSNYANQTLSNIWNCPNSFWGGRRSTWSCWSIDNPGNNYFYSFITATMSWALAAGDTFWRNDLTTRSLPMLTNYFIQPPTGPPGVGGGSQEGTGYGTSHMNLFSTYQIWKASTGEDLCGKTTHCLNSIDYWIHVTVPSLNYLVPFGDQARESTAAVFDYHRALMLRLQDLNKGTPQAQRARWWLEHISVDKMGQGFEYWIDTIPMSAPQAVQPTEAVYFSNFTGALLMRTGWEQSQILVSFLSGPFLESHAAQEIGGINIWGNRSWLAVTSNYFSHSGINQGVDTHNALRFESSPGTIIAQRNSPNPSVSYTQTAAGVTAVGTLSAVYSGTSVTMWKRTVIFTFATGEVETVDEYTVTGGTQAHWQLNTAAQPVYNAGPGTITAGSLVITPQFTLGAAPTILNWNSVDSSEWNGGWRVSFPLPSGSHVKMRLAGYTSQAPTPPTSAAPTAPTTVPQENDATKTSFSFALLCVYIFAMFAV